MTGFNPVQFQFNSILFIEIHPNTIVSLKMCILYDLGEAKVIKPRLLNSRSKNKKKTNKQTNREEKGKVLVHKMTANHDSITVCFFQRQLCMRSMENMIISYFSIHLISP